MQQRAISSIGVVAVGLIPALLGGWIFALVFTAICLVAYSELIRIVDPSVPEFVSIGVVVVAVSGLLATLSQRSSIGSVAAGLALAVPLIWCVLRTVPNPIDAASRMFLATSYLALPLVAAIQLRADHQYPAADWLRSLAGAMPKVGDATGGGLAWFLLALLVTWLFDTFAYLVGKTWGRRKLIPRISPNKTVEGSIGGLVAAGLTALLCNQVFGMDLGVVTALFCGLLLGAVGQLGDLVESMLKRARGVKDSGNLIPGHGGMLDRIDALVFVVTATWLLAPVVAK